MTPQAPEPHDELREALRDLLQLHEEERCNLDELGCNTHTWAGRPCPVERARALLDALEER